MRACLLASATAAIFVLRRLIMRPSQLSAVSALRWATRMTALAPRAYLNLDLVRSDQVYFNAPPQWDAGEICGFK